MTAPTHLRPKLLSLYRSLLRELPSRSLSNPSPLKQRLRDRFVGDRVSLRASHSPSPSPSSPSPSPSVALSAATLTSTSQSSPSPSPSASGDELRQLEEKVRMAEQFIAYARSQRMYATLVDRYNPGMDMDERERVRLTARRVGMDLPIEKGSDNSGYNGKQ